MQLPDEAIEAAAEAIRAIDGPTSIGGAEIARAALEAATPIIAAQVSDARINRVEVIDCDGRGYVRYTTAESVSIARQDGGRTLKVFIKEARDV